jgi:hypothetical protein
MLLDRQEEEGNIGISSRMLRTTSGKEAGKRIFSQEQKEEWEVCRHERKVGVWRRLGVLPSYADWFPAFRFFRFRFLGAWGRGGWRSGCAEPADCGEIRDVDVSFTGISVSDSMAGVLWGAHSFARRLCAAPPGCLRQAISLRSVRVLAKASPPSRTFLNVFAGKSAPLSHKDHKSSFRRDAPSASLRAGSTSTRDECAPRSSASALCLIFLPVRTCVTGSRVHHGRGSPSMARGRSRLRC